MRALRLAILNDYEVVVQGLRGMLEPYADRVSVVELDARKPVVRDVDVVLWDLFAQAMPRADRAETLTRVRESGARIVVFAWTTDEAVVGDLLRRGADGYVCKAVDPDTLVSALERVRAGEAVTVTAEGTVDGGAPGAAPRRWPGQAQGLTEREAEVVTLIAAGLSNQEIADRTLLSINSVKTYIRSAYRRMDVSRRSQAVSWAVDHGLQPDRARIVPDDTGAR